MNITLCYWDEADPPTGESFVNELRLTLPGIPRIGEHVHLDGLDAAFSEDAYVLVKEVKWHAEYVWVGGVVNVDE